MYNNHVSIMTNSSHLFQPNKKIQHQVHAVMSATGIAPSEPLPSVSAHFYFYS